MLKKKNVRKNAWLTSRGILIAVPREITLCQSIWEGSANFAHCVASETALSVLRLCRKSAWRDLVFHMSP